MTTWNDERGVNLANWRKRNGMTQPDLGARVGVSKSTISAWERNERAPSPGQIEALHAVADELAEELAEEIRGRLAAHEIGAPSRFKVRDGVGLASGDGVVASDNDAHVIVQGGDGALRVVNTDGDAPVRVEGMTVKVVPQRMTVTPTWDAFAWVDVRDGRRGVSLRAMVDAGLYASMEDAETAVDRGAGRWRVIRFTRHPSKPGPPGRQVLFFDVDEAIDFAAHAQTTGSAAVATVLMAHRDELLRITVSDEGAPGPDPYTTTIDWQRWAVEVDGVRGISLRAMVEAGLYTHYRDAVAALRGHGIQSAEISASSARTGPAPSDHLLTLKDAQRLAARAQTPTGRAILDLIIEHHDEFQRLLSGDRDAHERLADAQPNPAPDVPTDPLLAALAAAAETRRAQLAHEARLAALEHQMARATERLASVDAIHDARTLRPGEVYLSAVARHHGWLTSGGHAYPLAVRLSLACAGRPDYGVRRVMVPSPHAGQADVEALVISGEGLMWWRDHVRPWYEGQAVAGQVRIEPTDAARDAGMTRGCNVHLRGAEA